ncbi:MAG TPA: hypothetical protein VK589_22670 [Chryseolinea sp.]|nr:hypothetical protein [Chryseolinea sp.]
MIAGIRTKYSFLFLTFIASVGYGQGINNAWKTELTSSLKQFFNCQNSSSGKSECLQFMGESVKKIYKVNDFYSAKSGRYMTASEISSFLKESEKWRLIGPTYEQKTLATAQELANSGKAVVAVYINSDGIGHMVVITPGQLQPSGSWGLHVPNVVSFFPSQPDRSFVDKGLSFAFGKNLMKDILIYGRN